MGRLMGSSNSNNYGEQIFINKASEYLDDTNIIYWNRQLFGKEFDVCILMEFANITEYAHFVSNHFDAAIQRYSESRSVMERGNDVWSNAAVLRHLDEQVYTANRDVHTLLKIYYPEYAKDRHFLSYPIGQFFSAIYRLWDYENGKIIFDVSAIKECLSSNILSVAPGEVLLRTFYNVEILFENVTTYGQAEACRMNEPFPVCISMPVCHKEQSK